ncbi:seizure 6-like protein 2 [Notothenia coriiceps]|uniref:Seizure 6-like protein 2 n=1 Tax=Notothenia coriiceps TaxID=8208 RepID=A0A6I9MSN1_9TELE|nr:PREDICTED: seizure 6-like protein 2 [Notothenia coriiceps]
MHISYSLLNLNCFSPLTPAEVLEPCSHPGTPTYGVPSSNKIQFQAGETLHYSCLPGHQLLGESVLHCVPGHPSQWSGLPPVCKAHPANAEHRLDGKSSQEVHVSCTP